MTTNDKLREALIKMMVDRFLGWKLPQDFAPDCGISFKRESDYAHPVYGRNKFEPIGTNLFNAEQAREMLEYLIPADVLTATQQAAPSQGALDMPDTDGSFPEWKVGSFAFKQWCHQYFGPDADDGYLAEAVLQLPRKQVLPMKAADEFELQRLLAEERYTVRQLTRALRDAVEPPTFMGEPVGKAVLLEASTQQGEIVITKNESGQIAAVTRQDEEGRILEVIAEASAQREQPSASNQSANELLGAKIRKLCDGGAFDLTDSPKSMLDTVVRLCAETANSKTEPQAQAGEARLSEPEPQAQAGEPEGYAFGCNKEAKYGSPCCKKWCGRTECPTNDPIKTHADEYFKRHQFPSEGYDYNGKHAETAYTLRSGFLAGYEKCRQSHREAIAKKDAALKACVEALQTCSPGDYSTGHVIEPSFDEQAVDAAITQGQEALK